MYNYSKTCPFRSLDDIKGKKVTVMGLGLNGGGEASVRFFLKHGAFVTATDTKTQDQLRSTIDSLENDSTIDKTHLKYVLGCHKIEDFETADCVIKNPGVKIEGNNFLAAARSIETDISIFLRFTKSKIIAVTGSKGKSSTVSAINYGLNQAGFESFLGGNITVSPLTFLEKTSENTITVLELSSWQLSDLRGRSVLKPFISIITKIVPDHQDWYKNINDYVADKRLIYADQDENDWTIVGEDEWGKSFANETKAKVLQYFDFDTKPTANGVFQEKDENGEIVGKVKLSEMKKPETIMKKLAVPGTHTKENVLNACLVLYLLGVEAKKIVEIMSHWQGLPHRLQYFFEYKNFRFYNDSAATVPEAAAEAVKAFSKPVILITGGTDKGLSLSPLTDAVKNDSDFPPKAIYLLSGTATDKLLPCFHENNIKYFGPFDNLESLLSALKNDIDEMTPPSKKFETTEASKTINHNADDANNIIVFSPGSTSFGMFANEFDRGKKFMEAVKKVFV